jgi:hypothetical protein
MALRRIVTPSSGTSGWKNLLANPKIQWKRGRSAWELAHSWEAAVSTESGLPKEVARVLETNPAFKGAELLLAVPEHKVPLDNDRSPSQSDLWLIIATPNGCASVTVESKAGEEFGDSIEQWLKQESKGKKKRLDFLTKTLGLSAKPPCSIRYQLMHRTAAAILEARRFRFKIALMLVQSFEESRNSWSDYERFSELLDMPSVRNAITGQKKTDGIDLFIGWVDSEKASV